MQERRVPVLIDAVSSAAAAAAVPAVVSAHEPASLRAPAVCAAESLSLRLPSFDSVRRVPV